MASSDVIELGSSDDEAEPVSKKKKPALNAMVHFPNEVPGLVINPLMPALPNLQKVLAGGAVTITNVKKNKFTTQTHKLKSNGRFVPKIAQKSPLKMPTVRNVSITNPIPVNSLSVNPLSLVNKQQNIRLQTSKLSLPPGITVKRTASNQNTLPNVAFVRKKQILKRKQPAKIITTVELDDEEIPLSSGSSPQWYLRPEEQNNKPIEEKKDESEEKQNDDKEKSENMELENNKEPDTSKYIEITIEDSPIKPLQVMRGFEVGLELPITIEDSPVKPIKAMKEKQCTSDSDAEKSIVTEPQSRKKLDYPKDQDGMAEIGAPNIVEVDMELVPSANEHTEKIIEKEVDSVVDENIKDTEVRKDGTPRRVQTVLITKDINDEGKSNQAIIGQNTDAGEFHQIYQKFIDLCFELENSADMSKIVEKKIKTYYRQCPKEYVESEEFTDMVSSKIFAMKAAPDKMYLYIKDIVDELNLQRKSAKAVEVSNKENKKAGENVS